MKYNRLISAAAVLTVGSTLAYAAPAFYENRGNDHASKQGFERSMNGSSGNSRVREDNGRNDDYKRKDNGNRKDTYRSKPEKYTPHPVKPLPQKQNDRRAVTPPTRGFEQDRSSQKKYTPHPVKPLPGQYDRRDGEVRRDGYNNYPQKYPSTWNTRNHKHYYRPPGVKPLPYYHRPGHVVRTLPRVAVTLSLGGLLFYYVDGIYYRHYDYGFVVAAPPIGMIITTLPVGYTIFAYHGITYYYYADVYYVRDNYRRGYRVVEAPLDYSTYAPGDIIDTLPDGAYSVTINGTQYYRYGDVYFMQTIQGDRIVYIVVNPR